MTEQNKVSINGEQLTVNGKFATKTEAMQATAQNYLLRKESGEDLRYMATFDFIPTEDPRITKKAELDKRYMPTLYKSDGTLDRRYKSNKA